MKWTDKTKTIPYNKIIDVYITKFAPDAFSTFERNIAIKTKGWYFYIEKSWLQNSNQFYSLLENLQVEAGIEKNKKIRK